MKNINIKLLIVCILIPLAVGALSGFLTKNAMFHFNSINKPALAPPGFLFPIVWTILYILMGITLYIILTKHSDNEGTRKICIFIFVSQLLFNFFWSIIFFNMMEYYFAFIWLVILWIMVLLLIINTLKISTFAALIQIPYILWMTFAGYLNISIAMMN